MGKYFVEIALDVECDSPLTKEQVERGLIIDIFDPSHTATITSEAITDFEEIE